MKTGPKAKKKSYNKPRFKQPEDKLLTNMRAFYQSVDWAAWWEEWYLGVNSNGEPKYRRLKDFICDKAESQLQREFLTWYLGPAMDTDTHGYYPFITDHTPVDWMARRKCGGWYSDANLTKFSQEIARKSNALEALKEAGNRVTLHSLYRAGNLARELDDAFRGRFFLPGLNLDANERRAKLYLDLHERILGLIGKAQDLYAKSHGVNFDDMAGLVKLMEAAAMRATQQEQVEGRPVSREQKALSAVVEMALTKHATYKMAIPADVETKIVDVMMDDERIPSKKKVQ